MSETGSIKFSYDLIEKEITPFPQFEELNASRRKLQQLRLLGVDKSGIGFGNVSVRNDGTERFYVTGSGTGGLPALTLRDYALVTVVDFEQNWLRCEGVTVASAESLTHAAIYAADAAIGAVIHAHSAKLWAALTRLETTTSADVEYGTPAMAREVLRIFRETDVRDQNIFAMGGHEDGIVAFGSTISAALVSLVNRMD